jgi:hypothetical protein
MKRSIGLYVLILFVFGLAALAATEDISSRPSTASISGGLAGGARVRAEEDALDRPPRISSVQSNRLSARPMDSPLIDQLCIDDGVVVSGYSSMLANDIYAVSYTAPLYPAVVESVQVYILSEGDPFWPWPDSIHQPFAVSVYDENGGQPGSEIFRDTVQADDVPPSWVMAYPNVVVYSGDFWVAAEQLDTMPLCEGVGIDVSYDNGPQNWYRAGGVWTQNPPLAGDLMICAFVSTLLDTSTVILSGNSVMPPTFDGVIDSAEWTDATVRDVSDVFGGFGGVEPWGSAWLFVKNDEEALYLALDAPYDTSQSDFDDFSPYFDDNHDGFWPTAPDSNEGNLWFRSWATGIDSVEWRYFQSGPVTGPQRWVSFPIGVSLNSGHQQFEGAVPFGALPEELQAMPGDTVGFFLLAYVEEGLEVYAWWPYHVADFTDPSLYGDLVLAPGFPPVLMLAEASDSIDSVPGIDPDDYVLLEFDEPTNKPVVDWSNINNVFQLSGGHTWLDGSGNIGSAAWNGPGTQLVITLSTASGPPTVAVGDTITPDGVTVTDVLGNPCDSPIEITGSFGEPIGVEELKSRVAEYKAFALSANSPNPFCRETEIRYSVPDRSHVSLRVYDLAGRLVRTLVEEETRPGIHVARWDGRDETGSIAPTGAYLYRLRAGDFASTRKLVVMR